MPTAVVFPGQGSQSPGFALPWIDHPAHHLIATAETAAGRPLADLVTDPDADLGPTRASQLSVLLGSLIVWEAVRPLLDADDGPPIGFAGHSLGQITALIASGAVDLDDGLQLAMTRADASAHAQSVNPGVLIALLGATDAQARQIVDTVGSTWIANVNGGGQIVLGCRPDAADDIEAAAQQVGVRRTRRLAVDGAFHTPLMQPAADQLAPALDRIVFTEPSAPIVTNHDAAAVTSSDGWPLRLRTHLIAPVQWEAVVHRLIELGADRIVEVGPGRTLTGLVRRIAPDVETLAVSTPEDLQPFTEPVDTLAVGMAR